MDNTIRYAVYDTPAGDVTIVAVGKKIRYLLFGSHDPIGAINQENTTLYDCIVELNQYFYGQLAKFSLPLSLEGLGDFERRVYEFVETIAYGSKATYEEVAAAIGEPAATNAVQLALEHNPIPVLIPCHRVVKSEEDIGTFVDKIDLKRKMLELEASRSSRFAKI